MNCRELITYLSRFDPEELVGVVMVDPEKRIHFKLNGLQLLDESPVMLIEISDAGPLDEILEEQEATP